MVVADLGPALDPRWWLVERTALIVISIEQPVPPFPRYPVTKVAMDTSTLLFVILTICLVGATVHAWCLGNEKRDVVLLGVFSGLMSVGAAVSSIL